MNEPLARTPPYPPTHPPTHPLGLENQLGKIRRQLGLIKKYEEVGEEEEEEEEEGRGGKVGGRKEARQVGQH